MFTSAILPPSTSARYAMHLDFLVIFLTGKLGNLFALPCSEILHLDLHFLKVAQQAVAHPTTCHQLNSSFREVAPVPLAKRIENTIILQYISDSVCVVLCVLQPHMHQHYDV